jgi:DNA polymerase III subunit delta
MKIAPARTQGFVEDIAKSACFSVLIYGPDYGATLNIANRIAGKIVKDPSDPFSATSIDNNRISQEPTVIFDEMSAISLFGDKKLIVFKNAENSKETSSAIESAIKDLPESAKKSSFLIVTAGDLPPTSALRKFYESNEACAAIACYIEDEKDLSVKINRIFSSKKLRAVERGVIEYLADSCQGDSKIIESEIEKLELYLGETKEVKLEDVLATTGNTTEVETQDINNFICEGKPAQAQIAVKRAMDAGVAPIFIIRSLQRYIEKLHNCVNQVRDEGKSVDAVIESLRPPIFFKQKPAFRNHLNLIMKKPANDIWKAYSVLYEAESELKDSGAEPELITSRAVSKVL